jgi:2-polyprenyl-3-methyl-5-hydroxy-6-metoxy-1,4-benzoquinol methylase
MYSVAQIATAVDTVRNRVNPTSFHQNYEIAIARRNLHRDNELAPARGNALQERHVLTDRNPVAHWDALYREVNGNLPWEVDETPLEFDFWAKLLAPRASILDLGCGRGQHAITMAAHGFNVLGIDFSPAAIHAAIRTSEMKRATNVRFEMANILTHRTQETFDFVYDYSVFHHISRIDRSAYVATVSVLTRRGGLFAIVCYSDEDAAEGFNSERERVGKLGNTILHPTLDEVMELFGQTFTLESYRTSLLGPLRTHQAHHFLFSKI